MTYAILKMGFVAVAHGTVIAIFLFGLFWIIKTIIGLTYLGRG